MIGGLDYMQWTLTLFLLRHVDPLPDNIIFTTLKMSISSPRLSIVIDSDSDDSRVRSSSLFITGEISLVLLLVAC